MITNERMLVDWKGLKALGWPFTRGHTYRLMDSGSFPRPIKFGKHRGCRIAWRLKDILRYIDPTEH